VGAAGGGGLVFDEASRSPVRRVVGHVELGAGRVHDRLDVVARAYILAPGLQVPVAPDGSNSTAQPWTFYDVSDLRNESCGAPAVDSRPRYVRHRRRDGPAPAALTSLNMLIETEGRDYTAAEYSAWLQEAGSRHIETVWFDAPAANRAVIGRKP
jgi:hypothetical protein